MSEATCQCADGGCHTPLPDARWPLCGRPIGDGGRLWRSDMQDLTGTLFCEHCWLDAVQSGVFTNEPPRRFRPVRPGSDNTESNQRSTLGNLA